MNSHPSAGLPDAIQKLLDERASRIATIATIDATLARVSSALNYALPKLPVPTATKTAPKAPAAPKANRKSAKNGQTANEFVMGLIQEKKNPTSSDINTAWKAAGRKWSADITLSQLTKAKKLTRTPLGKGIRGSRYTIAG
jgi:hypothetical protein